MTPPMDNLKSMNSYVSDIVGKAVMGTFDTMFGRSVTSARTGAGIKPPQDGEICSHVSLTQGAQLNVEFSFHFDETLLHRIAEETYPQQARNMPLQMICEDMACAIANVVGSRVKAFLNGRGYDLSMDIPGVGGLDGQAEAGRSEQSHLSFRCAPDGQDNAVFVNIHLQEKRAG
ncbi:MAG TPA: hypothetical protein VEF76_05505 [Patescibacteria group bacterium]|nr:hypothetical protein [Patescibacteria group bacterium]